MKHEERINRYLDAVPPCIAGQGGDNQLFKVACALYNGFALTEAETVAWLVIYNRKCEPMWPATRLQYKAEQAANTSHEKVRGYLLGGEIHHTAPLPSKSIAVKGEIGKSIQKGRLAIDAIAIPNSLAKNEPPVFTPKQSNNTQSDTHSRARELKSGMASMANDVFQPLTETNSTECVNNTYEIGPETRQKQLDELANQGMPEADRDFASALLDTFQAKPKPKKEPLYNQEPVEKRKKLKIRNFAFSPNYVQVYPWAMWEMMEGMNDPQWETPNA
jgi:hypothetical protein